MLSKIAKLSLVATSLAPIFLTLWFIDFSRKWSWKEGLPFFVIAVALTIICCCLLKLSKQRLEKIPVKIASIKTADNEMVGFVLVYLLPLINRSSLDIDGFVLAFVAIMFFVIVKPNPAPLYSLVLLSSILRNRSNITLILFFSIPIPVSIT